MSALNPEEKGKGRIEETKNREREIVRCDLSKLQQEVESREVD